MSHLFIVKKSSGYSINALFSEGSDGDSYAMSFTCVHRRPLKDDGLYDFYDCVHKGLAGEVEVSQLSFNPRLFQVVLERQEVS